MDISAISRRFRKAAFGVTAAFAALVPPQMATAQYNGLSVEDIVTVELIEGWRREDGTHMAGLHIQLAAGWKTYWRSPGDAGIPPRLQLSTRGGELESVAMHWPTPEVFHANGMRSIGYSSDVVLPLRMTLSEGAGEVRLTGELEIGICEDICIPVSLDLSGLLPVGGRPNSRIAAALADRPSTASEAGAGQIHCRLTPIADGLRVEASIPLPRRGQNEAVVIELPDPGIWISEPVAHRSGGTLVATADIVPPVAGPFALDRSSLRFTVFAAGRAVELTGCRG